MTRQTGTPKRVDHAPVTSGKYMISPLIKAVENGWYACSVSIRSGSGQGTTDRVLRFTQMFRDGRIAADYARAEGLQWVGASSFPGSSLAARPV
jgi:hypothetical protein